MRYFLDPEGHIQKIPKGSKFYKESCPHIRSLFWLQIRCSKPATFVRGPCAVCKILRFETLRSQLSQEWKNYDEGVAIILKFAICWDGAKFWNRNQISHKNWLEIFADFKISSPAIGWNFIKFYFETSIFSLLWLIRGWALSWSWAQCALRSYLLMGPSPTERSSEFGLRAVSAGVITCRWARCILFAQLETLPVLPGWQVLTPTQSGEPQKF